MLKYVIIFSLLGFLLSKFIEEDKTVFGVFLAISVIWGLSSAAIWGLVTFGELTLGYGISKALSSS